MESKTVKINRVNNLVYITFPKLSATNAVRHAFSTRYGGVSSGCCSSMNLSFNRGEPREIVEKNYNIFCSAVGIDVSHIVLSKQTHTNNVVKVTSDDKGTGFSKPSFEDVDGLITDEPGVALVTQYADCTPLLFCDPKKKVIANSHSGWRGTVKKIGQVTVEKMVNEFGCKREDIVAAIGPCIMDCCYEVDEPVFEEFSKTDIDLDKIMKKSKNSNRFMLDLRAANREILLKSGIREENLDVADICTCCNSDELFSHRATNGKRGNLAAIIELI